MLNHIAQFLRKLADFIDPRVKPSDSLTIVISADTSQAVSAIGAVSKQLDGALKKSAQLGAQFGINHRAL